MALHQYAQYQILQNKKAWFKPEKRKNWILQKQSAKKELLQNLENSEKLPMKDVAVESLVAKPWEKNLCGGVLKAYNLQL